MKKIILFLLLISISSIYAFDEINITVRGSSRDQVRSRLLAKAVEEYNTQVGEEKISLYLQYGLIYQESMQTIPYSLFNEVFEPLDLLISHDDNGYQARYRISADSLAKRSERVGKKHYEKALQLFTEYQATSIEHSNFNYILSVLMQAVDELIKSFEYDLDEQLQAMAIFQEFEHFVRQFNFISPASQIVAAEHLDRRQSFNLYFNKNDNKIPLPNIPIVVYYPNRVERFETNEQGKCEISIVENDLLKYDIQYEKIFKTDTMTNPMFINKFIKYFLQNASGSFIIESLDKKLLYAESNFLEDRDLRQIVKNYAKQGYSIVNEKYENAYTLRISLIFEEDKVLYIGGHYLKAFVLNEIFSPAGNIISSQKSDSIEVMTDQDRDAALKRLYKIVLAEVIKGD
ncbi:MAG: hypothetical protein LHW49_00170 [Candidatus Cloacimonetes bacterium]|nr:hypothetical protein [Candidatus Cloacimonadota bacterium]MDD3501847.1 hypothetical protein [Candidatus Cloacimonadota bacterium]